MFRHYNDLVNAVLQKFQEHRQYSHYVFYQPDIADWRIEKVPESTITLIRRFYDSGISDASAQALIWWVRNQHYFFQELKFCKDVILAKSEDLVHHPATAFAEIFPFIGSRFEPRFATSVLDSSVAKPQPPPIDSAVRDLCESLLERLNCACRDQKLELPALDLAAGKAAFPKQMCPEHWVVQFLS